MTASRRAGALALLAPFLPRHSPAQWRTPVPEPQKEIATVGGGCPFPATPHPLSFWTRHPLRRQCRNDLAIGLPAVDGRPITTHDFELHQTVTRLGTIAGHPILEVMLLIHPGPHALVRGEPAIQIDPDAPDALDTQWKTLLIATGNGHRYTQIYGLQFGSGGIAPLQSAAIYGSGDDRILATNDSDGGNGGGCWDGYWWFDRTGAHPVDFSPLDRAIQPKLPPNTSYTGRCWAIHPETSSIQSGVQRTNAECHACGFVGDLAATYRITHGVAEPVSITFTPQPE